MGNEQGNFEMKDLILSEQKLLKLTSTIMLDFLNDLNGWDRERITVADIQNYCREWIIANVRDE